MQRRHAFPTRAIAVLGNGLIQENGITKLPDHVLKRLDYTEDLYRVSKEKPLIAVLGKWSFWYRKGDAPATTEAAAMEKHLVAKGVPTQSIYPERESEDTIGNALRLREILAQAHIRQATILCADDRAERTETIFRMLLGNSFSLRIVPTPGPFTGDELERQKHLQHELLMQQMPFLEELLHHPKLQENLYDNSYYTNQLRREISETGKSALGVTSGIER